MSKRVHLVDPNQDGRLNPKDFEGDHRLLVQEIRASFEEDEALLVALQEALDNHYQKQETPKFQTSFDLKLFQIPSILKHPEPPQTLTSLEPQPQLTILPHLVPESFQKLILRAQIRNRLKEWTLNPKKAIQKTSDELKAIGVPDTSHIVLNRFIHLLSGEERSIPLNCRFTKRGVVLTNLDDGSHFRGKTLKEAIENFSKENHDPRYFGFMVYQTNSNPNSTSVAKTFTTPDKVWASVERVSQLSGTAALPLLLAPEPFGTKTLGLTIGIPSMFIQALTSARRWLHGIVHKKEVDALDKLNVVTTPLIAAQIGLSLARGGSASLRLAQGTLTLANLGLDVTSGMVVAHQLLEQTQKEANGKSCEEKKKLWSKFFSQVGLQTALTILFNKDLLKTNGKNLMIDDIPLDDVAVQFEPPVFMEEGALAFRIGERQPGIATLLTPAQGWTKPKPMEVAEPIELPFRKVAGAELYSPRAMAQGPHPMASGQASLATVGHTHTTSKIPARRGASRKIIHPQSFEISDEEALRKLREIKAWLDGLDPEMKDTETLRHLRDDIEILMEMWEEGAATIFEKDLRKIFTLAEEAQTRWAKTPKSAEPEPEEFIPPKPFAPKTNADQERVIAEVGDFAQWLATELENRSPLLSGAMNPKDLELLQRRTDNLLTMTENALNGEWKAPSNPFDVITKLETSLLEELQAIRGKLEAKGLSLPEDCAESWGMPSALERIHRQETAEAFIEFQEKQRAKREAEEVLNRAERERREAPLRILRSIAEFQTPLRNFSSLAGQIKKDRTPEGRVLHARAVELDRKIQAVQERGSLSIGELHSLENEAQNLREFYDSLKALNRPKAHPPKIREPKESLHWKETLPEAHRRYLENLVPEDRQRLENILEKDSENRGLILARLAKNSPTPEQLNAILHGLEQGYLKGNDFEKFSRDELLFLNGGAIPPNYKRVIAELRLSPTTFGETESFVVVCKAIQIFQSHEKNIHHFYKRLNEAKGEKRGGYIAELVLTAAKLKSPRHPHLAFLPEPKFLGEDVTFPNVPSHNGTRKELPGELDMRMDGHVVEVKYAAQSLDEDQREKLGTGLKEGVIFGRPIRYTIPFMELTIVHIHNRNHPHAEAAFQQSGAWATEMRRSAAKPVRAVELFADELVGIIEQER